MNYEIKKIEKYWTLIISCEDGTVNDYRFETKKEAQAWVKMVYGK